MTYALTDSLRLPAGPVSLADLDPDGKPGFDGGKRDGEKALREIGDELAELQERMFANAYTGGSRRVLRGAAGDGHLGQGRRASTTRWGCSAPTASG